MSTKKFSAFRSGGLRSIDVNVQRSFSRDRFDDFLYQIEVEFEDLADELYTSGWKTERSNERLAHILGILIFYDMNPLGGRTYLCEKRFSGRSPDIIHLSGDNELGQEAAVEIVATNAPSIEKIRDLNAAGLPVFVLFWTGDPKKSRFERHVQNELSDNHNVQTGTISLQYYGWANPGEPIGYNQERKISATEKLSAKEVFYRNLVPAYIEASGRVERLPQNASSFYRVSGIQVWDERHPIIHVDWTRNTSTYEILSCKPNGWCSLDPTKIIKAIRDGECKEIWPPYGLRRSAEESKESPKVESPDEDSSLTSEDMCLKEKARERVNELPNNHRNLIT